MTTTTIDPASVPANTNETMTRIAWATLVLVDGGYPVTKNNVTSMLNWMASENAPSTWTGTAGANNPLNNGDGSGGGAGLGSYPDLTTAASWVAKQLKSPDYNYPGIDAALKQSADPSVFEAAVINSGWASGHYDGGAKWSTSGVNSPGITAAQSAASGATKGVASGDASAPNPTGLLGQVGDALNPVTAAEGVVSTVEAVPDFLGKISSKSFWEPIGLFALGGAIALIGLIVLVSTSKTGEKAVSSAASAAPLLLA